MGTYTNLLYHIVFGTKCREPLITNDVQDELYSYLGGIISGEKGIPMEIGGVSDHVHILAKFSPNISVSDMLQKVKGNSSKWAKQRFDRLGEFHWQVGFGGFSVSESQVVKVQRYIRGQKEHHKKRSFKEELVQLLEKNGIEYDDRYLFE